MIKIKNKIRVLTVLCFLTIFFITIPRGLALVEDHLDWGVDRIDAERVWGGFDGANDIDQQNAIATGAGVKVCIIDTGIDIDHPDLKDNYKGGWDLYGNDGIPQDTYGHGTSMAGIIGAQDGGGSKYENVIGVAPEVELYAYRADDDGDFEYPPFPPVPVTQAYRGIMWAIKYSMDVILLECVYSKYLFWTEYACQKAYENGIVIVAPAGNQDFKEGVHWPACSDYVIAVGNMKYSYEISDTSSYGPEMEVIAPGTGIWTTTIDGTYTYIDGTCPAAAHVAGVCALILSENPDLTPDEVRAILRDSALDQVHNDDPEGWDEHYGYGLINAYVCFDDTPPNVEITSPTSYYVSEAVTIRADVSDDSTFINRVEFYIGNSLKFTDTDGSDGWSWIWYTRSSGNGYHVIKVKAYDERDNTGLDFKGVSVNNVDSGGGGECPNLLVWDGNEFIDEGVLPIHDDENPGVDMTLYHELQCTPAITSNQKLILKLSEISEGYTYSHSIIDQVQLFIKNEDDEWELIPLFKAFHSNSSKVKKELLFDDEIKTEIIKGEEITLIFLAINHEFSENSKLLFKIVGHNLIKW